MKVNLKIQDRDDLVVARILAGDYDKLAELKKITKRFDQDRRRSCFKY